MFTWLLRHFRSALPIPIPLLAAAVASGLAVGALYLGESVDLATAVGIAVCISVSVGSWLGIRLYLVVAKFYTAWLDAINRRIADVASRRPPVSSIADGHNSQRPRGSIALQFAANSIYATPLCFAMFTGNAIMAALWAQIDPVGAILPLGVALSNFVTLVFVIAIQSLYLWRLQRQVATLEQLLNRIDSVPPVVQRVQVLNRNIGRTARIVRRLTGISQTATEQATA